MSKPGFASESCIGITAVWHSGTEQCGVQAPNNDVSRLKTQVMRDRSGHHRRGYFPQADSTNEESRLSKSAEVPNCSLHQAHGSS
jgi:hypothetical protein